MRTENVREPKIYIPVISSPRIGRYSENSRQHHLFLPSPEKSIKVKNGKGRGTEDKGKGGRQAQQWRRGPTDKRADEVTTETGTYTVQRSAPADVQRM